MLYTKATIVKKKINEAGKNSAPFLFAVDYELKQALFIENPLSQEKVLFRFGDIKNYSNKVKLSNIDYLIIEEIISKDEYRAKFNKVLQGLQRGDSYLANLTVKTPIKTNLSLQDIMISSNSKFGICVLDHFVCFSPERFVKIEDGIISSNPMKGTIDASLPNAANIIMSDYKEMCEHNTIVDLIRNDIGMVSKKVWVEQFRYIDLVKTDRGELLQVSSQIKGELEKNYKDSLGDLIFKLLPAGSISGAPKQSTIKIISEAEGEKRGFYTGVFGYFDGKVFDSAVTIRYIEKDKNGKLFYKSGGGITVNSECDMEFNEMLGKIYLPNTK